MMEIRYVDIVRFDGNTCIILARGVWRGRGAVELSGSPEFVDELSVVVDQDGATFTPENGIEYLYALSHAYRTPYLMASAVEKGEPPPAEFG